MSLTTKSFSTLISDFALSVQSSSSRLVNFAVGSVLRALAEACGAVTLWLQGLILQTLALTRASTSTGSDLDSWFADYGFTREAAVAATGSVTFSRLTTGAQAVVPVGAMVQTADGSEQFTVTLDSSNSAYSADAGGYVISASAVSVTVPVEASMSGTEGNVIAGSIDTLGTAIAGVDAVTNAVALTNGTDAESDAAARTRFIQYIALLARGTPAAVSYAIASVSDSIDYSLTENEQYDGSVDYGYFYVIVDDGSGHPSDATLASVASAIEATRPIGIRYGVFRPAVLSADVAMTLDIASGYARDTVTAQVATAVTTFIDSLGVGVTLPYTRLAQVAYDVVPGAVLNVSGVSLNNGTADIVPTNKQTVKAGTITVA